MRRRITAIAVGLAAVVLLVAGLVVVAVMRAELQRNIDRSLEQRAEQIEASFESDPSVALVTSNTGDHFTQLLDADGVVVAATPNVAGEPALVGLPDGRQSVVTRDDLPIEDDVYRVLIRRFDVEGRAQYVVVGENVDDLRDGVRALTATLAVVFPLAVVVLGVVVWWLVGRTLRPVERIRSEVASIGLGELDRRVPVPGSGDEVDLLASTMNEMLGRLDAAAGQQRRFVADASHELRTPLTRLRTSLEVELVHPDDDSRAAVASALDDVVEMQDLVDGLLFLARVDAGAGGGRSEPVDLDVVVAGEVDAARRESARVTFDTRAVEPVVVRGDRGQLSRVVRNLLSNAARHAVASVAVELVERGGEAVLVVADDGPGVAFTDRERLFDRFVRLDGARSPGSGGVGLGLAIVREIVHAHGGSVTVSDAEPSGARFVVSLPAAPS